jgi:magnesium transporter
VAVRPGMTAGEALAHIRKTGKGKETLNVVYIVDDAGKLVEDVRLGSLVLAEPDTKLSEIEDPALVAITATDSVEDVLRAFEKYDRVALPVVDRDQKMLGIITVDDVLDLAESETTRDIQKVGGTEALDAAYLKTGFWSLLRKRGGWLSALFLGEMLTATAMGHFEVEIQRAVGRIILWQRLHFTDYGIHYLLVGATVWASLIGVVTFGSVSGSMLPFILRRLGFDPATSSAPFVATLVDVTGLVIYFSIALLILRGTLL